MGNVLEENNIGGRRSAARRHTGYGIWKVAAKENTSYSYLLVTNKYLGTYILSMERNRRAKQIKTKSLALACK